MMDVRCEQAKMAARVFERRLHEWLDLNGCESPIREVSYHLEHRSGYQLKIESQQAEIRAHEPIEFFAASGALLRKIARCIGKGEGQIESSSMNEHPRYANRTHYMPGHFGNSFEVAWPDEMKYYLEDLALFGSNGYADWMDPNDMPDPYHPHVYCSSSMTLWQRKKEYFRYAKQLGMKTSLLIAHNVAFTDQLEPSLLGVKSHTHRVQGQVLCPSKPRAREICLQNVHNLMSDFIASNVVIDRIVMNPYDDGGCACDACQPYYPTFLSMVYEIFEIVQSYYPDVMLDICGWWTEDDEIVMLKDLAKKVGKNFGEFMYSVTYRITKVPATVWKTIDPIPMNTFVHIGFSDTNTDTYVKTGIHNAQSRIQTIIRSFEKARCTGFTTYNEFFSDHYNQFMITALARDPDLDIDQLTLDYCMWMFSLKEEQANILLAIMNEMQYHDPQKAENWENQLLQIKPHVMVNQEQRHWLFEHVLIKAQLMALDHRIGDHTAWESKEDVQKVLPWIEKRQKLFGDMYRKIYGLGVMRHAFIPDRMQAPWYPTYCDYYQKAGGKIIPGMTLSGQA